jgi:hypothetical protein
LTTAIVLYRLYLARYRYSYSRAACCVASQQLLLLSSPSSSSCALYCINIAIWPY